MLLIVCLILGCSLFNGYIGGKIGWSLIVKFRFDLLSILSSQEQDQHCGCWCLRTNNQIPAIREE